MLRRLLLLLLTPPLLLLVLAATAVLGVLLLPVVGLVDLLAWPFTRLFRRELALLPRDPTAASIVTVSWNGRHFLEVLLPSLREAVRQDGGDHEVIVVDNGSTDGTVAWLAEAHPWVRVVALPENRYFVRGNLAGVEAATRDVLVFVNNDMEVAPGFLTPLLAGLRDPRVFAVAAEVFFRDRAKRREETGRTRGEIRGGWLRLAHVEPTRDERELEFAPALWAGGGSAAFDRRMYLELGGFDQLYDPFYLEDTSLSYQAWKRGWRVLFTSRSSVLHEHRGTSRKAFGDDYVDNTIRRNQHLFLWRNVTDPLLIGKVLLGLPLALLGRAARPGRSFAAGAAFELKALLRALPRLPAALARRCESRRAGACSDRQVFARANSIAAHRRDCGTGLGATSVPAAGGRRILVLSARLPRVGHDGSWVLFERLRAMAQRHRVTLFAFLDEPGEDAAAAPLRAHGIEVVTAVRERNPMPGNLHHFVPWRLWRDYSAPAMRQAVRRMLEGTDHDLVQVEYAEMAHLVAAEPRVQPRLYVCHESLAVAAARAATAARGPLARLRGWFRARQADRYERWLLRRFDRVAALSAADALAMRGAVRGRPIEVVPSGIDVPAAAPARGPEPATIVFVGYYGHEPNVDAAVWLAREILPRVRAQVPGARLRLVGGGVTAAVAALRGGAVEVAGHVPDLAAALAAATVVALPLRTGGGLRGKVLEAWAAGRAVVATSVALEGFSCTDGEHCLLADDAEAFAAALVRCLREPRLARALGEAGQALARARYSVGAAGERFDSIYGALGEVRA